MNKRADAITDTRIENKKLENMKKTKSQKSVYIYIAALFIIVVLFILLSYFMQQRNNSTLSTLSEQNATAQQNIENLQTTNQQLQAENDIYEAKLTDLQTQIGQLEDQLEGVRLAWQNDMQNIKKNDLAKYNELFAKYSELIEKYEVKGNNND